MRSIRKTKLFCRFKKVDQRQWVRYGVMILGILALAPPVGFVVQLFGSGSMCGNLCPRMAIGSNFVREIFTRPFGIALLFIWLGITFFYGRWVCSHVCPTGALTEFGSKLIPSRLKIDYSKFIDTSYFRYGFLGAYILLPILGLQSICCSYCSFSVVGDIMNAAFKPELVGMLLTGSRLVSIFLFVLLFGIFSRDGRAHCHMVCPVGALDSLINNLGANLKFTKRERVRLSDCSGCGQCAVNCPASAIEVDKESDVIMRIDYNRCYQCRKCEGDCPTNAIYYGRRAGEMN